MKYIVNTIINNFSISEKLKVDTIWNLVSYFVISLSGLSFTLLIAKYFSPNILGIMNISLIILTICSQLSGLGIHFSVLKHVVQYSRNINTVSTIMVSALLLVTLTSAIICLVFYLLINPVNTLFPERNMLFALTSITPSLYFLAVNKIIFGYYNALRKMKIYAILNMLRYLNWILFVLIFIIYNLSYLYLPLIFLGSEIVIFIINIPLAVTFVKNYNSFLMLDWIKIHFNFGFRSMYGAVFVDLNSRIDVLALSFFTNSYITGIYTIASMIVDGFLQLINVFRIIINPIITKYFTEYDIHEFLKQIKKGKILFYFIGVPLIILTILLFPVIINIFNLNNEYNMAYIPLIISLSGLLLSFGYQPYQMLFIQTGFPFIQTIFWGIILITNIILSSILVNLYGILGAGIVTSVIFMLTPLIINLFSKKYLKISF